MTDAVIDEPVRPKQPERITPRAMATVACVSLGTWTYGFIWNSVGVALPHMQGSFSATTDQVTWVMVAFIIGSATMTASVGWLAGRFGRRQIYLTALVLYAISLVGCGFSTTLTEAVGWRLLQGFSAAPLLPLGQVIAINAFPPGRHGQATSFWAIGFVTGNVVGPTLAGYLIEHFGWAWIFFSSLPVVCLVFIGAWFLVERTPRRRDPLDWVRSYHAIAWCWRLTADAGARRAPGLVRLAGDRGGGPDRWNFALPLSGAQPHHGASFHRFAPLHGSKLRHRAIDDLHGGGFSLPAALAPAAAFAADRCLPGGGGWAS